MKPKVPLLEKEVIFKDDLLKIFGERPFKFEEPIIKKKGLDISSDEETTEE